MEEFNILWDKQATFHPVMNSEYNGKPLKTVFRETIFHQLPLKSISGMVGKCPLELCSAGKPHLPRAPRAHPAAQAFRIEKQLADLRWGIGKNAQTLSNKQTSIIRALLNTQ